jgi:hypothetical protein
MASGKWSQCGLGGKFPSQTIDVKFGNGSWIFTYRGSLLQESDLLALSSLLGSHSENQKVGNRLGYGRAPSMLVQRERSFPRRCAFPI